MRRPRIMESGLFERGETLGELLVRPFQVFAARHASGGILLLVASFAAMVWINSPFAHSYEVLLQIPLEIGFDRLVLIRPLHFWINDGLMAIFFLVVGLEIKREMLVGELASFRYAALPVAGAAGGMAVPALIYYAFNQGTPEACGWGVPMATDIAFTLGALMLLGNRIPNSLKVFLVALAIADDLGAVLVIAAFYSGDISVFYLAMGGVCLAGLAGLNLLGFRRPLPYILVGMALWLMVELSGIHATLSGVLVALTIPARTRCDTDTFLKNAGEVLDEFDCAGECGYSMYVNEDHQTAVNALEELCHHVQPSLQKIENNLHPWVAFLILPVFGLANAGFHLDTGNLWRTIADPIFLGIALGLFVGKQLGIFLACWIAIKVGLAAMPRGSNFGEIYGGAVLCGIGFTMSLFIGHMAFASAETLNVAKMGILSGSVLSLLLGTTVLYVATGKTGAASLEPS